VTQNAYVGDGQWHHFGSQSEPAIRAISPKPVPQIQHGEPVHVYNVASTQSR
jgi:hypothetical protein